MKGGVPPLSPRILCSKVIVPWVGFNSLYYYCQLLNRFLLILIKRGKNIEIFPRNWIRFHTTTGGGPGGGGDLKFIELVGHTKGMGSAL